MVARSELNVVAALLRRHRDSLAEDGRQAEARLLASALRSVRRVMRLLVPEIEDVETEPAETFTEPEREPEPDPLPASLRKARIAARRRRKRPLNQETE